jgi:hypothetical protein
MKTSAFCHRSHQLRRLACIALVWPLLTAQAVAQEPDHIDFPFEHVSDLRGILNVMSAFRTACLDQPVSRDLPEALAPDGYLIVSPSFHLFGDETVRDARRTVLSKTGTEEGDFAEGYPIIRFGMSTDETPYGECSVTWTRAWDYPGEQVDDVMFGIAAQFDSQLSYRLQAVLVSPPENAFNRSSQYGLVSEWRTGCWEGNDCVFDILLMLDSEDGIHFTITRKKVLPVSNNGENGGTPGSN